MPVMGNNVQSVQGAPGVTLPGQPTSYSGRGGLVPFRKATLRKLELGVSGDAYVLGAAAQPVNRVLEGTGFLEAVHLDVQCVTAANAAAVAFAPDAPWNVLNSVVFKDVGPDTINLDGYSLFLWNIYGGYHNGLPLPTASTDPRVFSTTVGAVATGGSFRFKVLVPLAINPRSLIGIMGNQDRAVKYELRTDISPNASLYTVAPTNPGTVTLNRMLRFTTVPAPQSASGIPQEMLPPHYGVIHLANVLTSETQPASGAVLNHFLRSIGNVIRVIILVFRDSTGARSDAMLPNRITFRVGADAIYSETSAARRQLMYERYGFDAPAGVLVYDLMSDFGPRPGFELGDDWLDTRNIANAQFEMTYPAFANSPGNLQVITDSLVIPQGVDISQYV